MKTNPKRSNLEILTYLSNIGMLDLQETEQYREFRCVIEDVEYRICLSKTELKITGEQIYV